MLYSIVANTAVLWNGETIDGVNYPSTIDQLWSNTDLATIGLYHPLPADPVPTGKQVESSSVQVIGGVVKFVNVLEDVPGPPPPTSADVDAERDRRTALPLPVQVTNDVTFSVNMDDTALRNMAGLASAAILQKISSANVAIQFITYENQILSLYPDDLISMGEQVQARITLLTIKGREIKNTVGGIPVDYAVNDTYWE